MICVGSYGQNVQGQLAKEAFSGEGTMSTKKWKFDLAKRYRDSGFIERLGSKRRELAELLRLDKLGHDAEPIIKKGFLGGIQALMSFPSGVALITTDKKCEVNESTSRYLPYSDLRDIAVDVYKLDSLVFGFTLSLAWDAAEISIYITSVPPGWSLISDRIYPKTRIDLLKSVVGDLSLYDLSSKLGSSLEGNAQFCLHYVASMDGLHANSNEFAQRFCMLFVCDLVSDGTVYSFNEYLFLFDSEYKQALCKLEDRLNNGNQDDFNYLMLVEAIEIYHFVARARQVFWASARGVYGKMGSPSWPIDEMIEYFNECEHIYQAEINVSRRMDSPQQRAWYMSNKFGSILHRINQLIPD